MASDAQTILENLPNVIGGIHDRLATIEAAIARLEAVTGADGKTSVDAALAKAAAPGATP